MAVFGKIFWGGFWRVWAPKVAVSDFDLLETLIVLNFYKVFELKKMSDTSEDISSESARIPYSERAEWSDIQPLNQEDGDVPVVKIAYSDKCKQIIH